MFVYISLRRASGMRSVRATRSTTLLRYSEKTFTLGLYTGTANSQD